MRRGGTGCLSCSDCRLTLSGENLFRFQASFSQHSEGDPYSNVTRKQHTAAQNGKQVLQRAELGRTALHQKERNTESQKQRERLDQGHNASPNAHTRHMPAEMAPQAGLEPATCCLEGSCSVQLSYWGARKERKGKGKGGSILEEPYPPHKKKEFRAVAWQSPHPATARRHLDSEVRFRLDANRIDMEADVEKLVEIEEIASVEHECRLAHQTVNVLPVYFAVIIPVR